MNDQQIMDIFTNTHAIIEETHVVLKSGRHGSAYINKDAIYPYTDKIAELCYELVERLIRKAKVFEVDVVVGPALGGIILSQWIAYNFSSMKKRDVLAVYAEKDGNDAFIIKRGYDKLIKDKKVLIVEDVLTTGGSVKKVVEVVRALGGQILGVGALCNRGNVTVADIGDVPVLLSLVNDLKMETWAQADCPLCAQDVPINTDVGKGREFLAAQQQG